MKIHEYQAKEILAKYNVPVPRGKVAYSVAEAEAIAKELGGSVVVKAQWADSAKGVAEASDVVFTCLPSPRAIDSVVCGPNGVLEGAHPGLIWIDNSTNDQEETLRLAAICEQRGVRMLESPVTGGVHKAAAGDITVLVGGDEATYAEVADLLEVIGNPVLHMGLLGSAAVIKVITNMLAFIHLSKITPHAGAAYAWVGHVFGKNWGFFAGWGLLIASIFFMVSATIPAATSTLVLIKPEVVEESIAVQRLRGDRSNQNWES